MPLVYPRPMELGPEEVERSLVVLVNFSDPTTVRSGLTQTIAMASHTGSRFIEFLDRFWKLASSTWNEMGSPSIVRGPITNCCSESGQHPVRLKLFKKSEQ